MSKLFDTRQRRTPELTAYFYRLLATNHRQIANIAEALADAAMNKSPQKRHDDLLAKHAALLVKAEELQDEMERLMGLPT